MADSIRQNILDALDALLITIMTANGYETNLGSNIFDWHEEPFNQSELPAIAYKDKSETATMDDVPLGYIEHDLTIDINIALQKDVNEVPVDVRKMIADVQKCIGTDPTLSGLLVSQAEYIGTEIDMDHKEKLHAVVNVEYLFKYRLLQGNPYQQ